MKILSRPRGNAEEYGKWSVNPYVGCPHGCKYCYLKKGVWAKGLGGNTPVLKVGIRSWQHAFYVAMAEIEEYQDEIRRDGGLFFSFTCDPMSVSCYPVTFSIILELADRFPLDPINVTVLTKDATFVTHYEYEKYLFDRDPLSRHATRKANQHVALGWTLTGHDELEPYADTNNRRLLAMEKVHKDGFKTWASIEPVIDFKSSYDMILAACDAGCRHFKIGLMTKNTKVCRKMYDHDACIEFIHDVMRVMEAGGGTATVYWKQSFRDFLGEEDFAMATVGYKNIVDKDWSMFNK